jgi:hypothetical protein
MEPEWTMLKRARAVLNGERPDQLPFITRLETWYKSHRRSGTLPEAYRELSLPELHRELHVGQLKFMVPFACRLRGVDVRAWRDGELIFHEYEPVVENFPGMWDLVSTNVPGTTVTELASPAGRLRLQHLLLEENVFTGTDPYLKEHLIKEDADFDTAAYILEHLELVPRFDGYRAEQELLGENAWVVPLLNRIPFQQVLLEYLGESALFYSLYDRRERVERLLQILDEQMLALLDELAELDSFYVEFPDNLHGLMTNPKLFRRYCLPHYQRYTAILHDQGKKVGSHTDGNIRPLLQLLVDSDLDVAESFSPYPLTPCRLEEALAAWPNGPLVWGGIPSPLLEESTSPEEFESCLEDLFQTIDRPMVLGVVDLFMRHNSIERVERIAQELRKRTCPSPSKSAPV